MEKFLETINNAPVKAIGSKLGIKVAESKKVAAARPYASLEDLASASGLSLEKLQELTAQTESSISPEQVAQPESEPTETPQESSDSSDPTKELEKPRRKTFSIIWRIFLWLVILAAIAIGLYYGIPFFKEKILTPLESNTSQVGELTTKQQADVDQLTLKINSLQDRAATLEAVSASDQLTLDAYQKTLIVQESALSELTGSLGTAIAELDLRDSILATKVDEQLVLNRGLQLLSRSRLYLSQSNFGLAREDISAARSLLFSLLSAISSEKENGLRSAIERLDFALVNLPAYPVVAVYDLDVAWQLLVDGLPNAPELVITPAIFVTETPYVQNPTPEPTPTPQP